jgi:hypothetical protein
MKKIEAVIRPNLLAEVKEALKRIGIYGMTITDALGTSSREKPTFEQIAVCMLPCGKQTSAVLFWKHPEHRSPSYRNAQCILRRFSRPRARRVESRLRSFSWRTFL